MGQFKTDQLVDRLEAIAKARQATLARFRARPALDDPAVLARQAARQAIVQAREVRINERDIARLAGKLSARLKPWPQRSVRGGTRPLGRRKSRTASCTRCSAEDRARCTLRSSQGKSTPVARTCRHGTKRRRSSMSHKFKIGQHVRQLGIESPRFPEAVCFGSGVQGFGPRLGIIAWPPPRREEGRRSVRAADGVEPVHPFSAWLLDLPQGPPRPASMDDLRLETGPITVSARAFRTSRQHCQTRVHAASAQALRCSGCSHISIPRSE